MNTIKVKNSIPLYKALFELGLVKTKSEGRRVIVQGGAYIGSFKDKKRITNMRYEITSADIDPAMKKVIVWKGKKNPGIVVIGG